jgi:2-amino-4-hydroxy-6-hydroxymethyldihydropteridine diphosphokinase
MTFSGTNFSAVRSIVFVAIGSNLDHPVIHVQRAMQDIDALPETALMKTSSLYETAPVGLTDQPVFVNAVVQIGTTLSAHELLRRLLAIEAEHGRLRNSSIEVKNAPRTLDLDILLFDESQIDERGLTVPHSRMHTRAFALVPLVEIAPDIVIPGKGVAKELLAALDHSGVALLQPEEY